MLEALPGLPPFVVAAKAAGQVNKTDFDNVLAPVFNTVADTYGAINFLLLLDDQFTSDSVIPLCQQLQELKYFTLWRRIAVVSNSLAIETILDQFSILNPVSRKGFRNEELPEAQQWITEV